MSRLVDADDVFRVRWPDCPRLSPDGRWLVYLVSSLDRERDVMVTHLWAQPLDGGPASRLTPDGASDTAPAWRPDGGALALVSTRSGQRQIWTVDMASGAARQITHAPSGADEPAWSPDGSRLAFVASVPAREPTPGLITANRYKADGAGLVPLRYKQVWTVAADGASQPVALISGEWDSWAPRWSPDGRWIACLSNRRDAALSDIVVMPAAGGPSRCLTGGMGQVRALAWAPDSQSLAFIGHNRGHAQGVNLGVWTVGLDGARPRLLTGLLDRSAGLTVRADDMRGLAAPDLAWVEGEPPRILFIFANGGRSPLASVGLDEQTGVLVGGARAVLAFDVDPAGGRLAFVASDALHPGEVYLTGLDGQGERAVTTLNADWLNEVRLSRPEPMPFRADDGQMVDAWLVRPPDALPGQPRPLVLQVHGGPHYPLGERFYLEFQRLAAQGYLVLYVNSRGSQGYGEAFATAIQGAWGERDYQDLMQAVDAVVAAGAADPVRLAITGVSYGGYMTHWTIAHTDRFRVAVSENGISNLVSVYGTTTGGQRFWEWELEGAPWEAPDVYRRLSPLTYVERVRTPLLLIHAELDCNCPIGQSEELFTALTRLGRDVALARIPGEGHLMNLVGKPSRRQQRTATLDAWLARYLKA